MEALEDCGTLRPPTPTGSVSDSDASDLQLRGEVLSPPDGQEEVDRPHTPGRGLDAAEVTADEVLFHPPAMPLRLPPPPSPTGLGGSPSYPLPTPLPSSYPAYEDIPRTPGHYTFTSAQRSRAFPDPDLRSLFPLSPPFQSPHPRRAVPRTPGRESPPSSLLPLAGASDFSEFRMHHREPWHGDHPLSAAPSQAWGAEGSSAPRHGSSPPCGRDTALSPHTSPPWGGRVNGQILGKEDLDMVEVVGARGVSRPPHKRRLRCKNTSRTMLKWRTTESREGQKESKCEMLPLVSTETCWTSSSHEPVNRPRLENHKNWPTLESLENHGLVRLYPRHRATGLHRSHRKRRHPDLPTAHPILRQRSRREERRALHAVWRVGVDEQEIGHLKHSYESMQRLRLGSDWLRSVTWVPHPDILSFKTSQLACIVKLNSKYVSPLSLK